MLTKINTVSLEGVTCNFKNKKRTNVISTDFKETRCNFPKRYDENIIYQ